ncbi:MAG: hypothetical protein PHP28_12645 [Actinomycetota bacterium]|nr:hypothetical protein [Actinomycetota bacterium]MDD5668286.1 hypothetical protein [Actinomycetota bacterium]
MGNDTRYPLLFSEGRIGDLTVRNRTVVEIGEGEIALQNLKTGRRVTRPVDGVVLAVGVRSDDRLARELGGRVPRVRVVGDAREPGRIHNAVRDGFDAAWEL